MENAHLVFWTGFLVIITSLKSFKFFVQTLQASSAAFQSLVPAQVNSNPAFVSSDQTQPPESPDLVQPTDAENMQNIDQVWEELLSLAELQVSISTWKTKHDVFEGL